MTIRAALAAYEKQRLERPRASCSQPQQSADAILREVFQRPMTAFDTIEDVISRDDWSRCRKLKKIGLFEGCIARVRRRKSCRFR